ncbi:MAG: hydrogenase maturation nickel metallochaperone HypA [Euryarchaeota archaeon]|nr:hydrogenase maturation nickel metallochaperone HypA [Euryarchaeota archaeon]
MLSMEEINQEAVFFRCRVCSFEFETDPNFTPIKCPQCGSEDTEPV